MSSQTATGIEGILIYSPRINGTPTRKSFLSFRKKRNMENQRPFEVSIAAISLSN